MGLPHWFMGIPGFFSDFAMAAASFFATLLHFLGLFDWDVFAITLIFVLGALAVGVGFTLVSRGLDVR